MELMWFEGDAETFESSFESIDEMIHEMIKEELEESFNKFLMEYYGIMVGFESETIRFESITTLEVLMSSDLKKIYTESIEEFGVGEIPDEIIGTECEDEYRVYYQLKHEWGSAIYVEN